MAKRKFQRAAEPAPDEVRRAETGALSPALREFSAELAARFPGRYVKRFVMPSVVREASEVFLVELTSRDEIEAAQMADATMSAIERASVRLTNDAEQREAIRLSIVGLGKIKRRQADRVRARERRRRAVRRAERVDASRVDVSTRLLRADERCTHRRAARGDQGGSHRRRVRAPDKRDPRKRRGWEVKRRLWDEYTRLYWHGYPGTFAEFIDLPMSDRYLANVSLTDLVERSNDAGGNRPGDDRK
jgi:hypothetical protein